MLLLLLIHSHPLSPSLSLSSCSYPRTTQHNLVVEALYDCDPDHVDELGFKEGDKIVVTKKLNKDWWVSHLLWLTRRSLLLCDNPIIETTSVCDYINSIVEQIKGSGTCFTKSMFQFLDIKFQIQGWNQFLSLHHCFSIRFYL